VSRGRNETAYANGDEDRDDVVDWRPLILDDVQADRAVRVHVGVEHCADEPHLELSHTEIKTKQQLSN
jgi:hypothetical protein